MQPIIPPPANVKRSAITGGRPGARPGATPIQGVRPGPGPQILGPAGPVQFTPAQMVPTGQLIAPPIAKGPPGAPTVPIANVKGLPSCTDETQKLTRDQRKLILEEVDKIEEELPALAIESSIITLFSREQLLEYAVVRVRSDAQRGLDSVNDPRMGVTEDGRCCATCHQDNIECPGHLGMIDLIGIPQPIYHPLYIRTIAMVLVCVCNSCGCLLLSKEEIEAKGLDRYRGINRLKALAEICGKIQICRNTEKERPPAVKNCPPNRQYVVTNIKDTKQIMYKIQGADKKVEMMPIREVQQILNAISPHDARLMGFEGDSHPSRMILTALPVIPPVARQPSYREGQMYPNELTEAYIQIVSTVSKLTSTKLTQKEQDESQKKLFNLVEYLIDNSARPSCPGNRTCDGIKQLIQGKEALIRGLLMGKRVNYSGRAVVGPGPRLKFGEVGFPLVMAPLLTQPVTVNRTNIREMTRLLREGKVTHITPNIKLRGRRFMVTEEKRLKYMPKLGDRFDRWLENDDVMLFNRQPTLHKQSMMGGKVRLHGELIIRLHMSCTTPLNADFNTN